MKPITCPIYNKPCEAGRNRCYTYASNGYAMYDAKTINCIAKRYGMYFTFDPKLEAWCFIDIQHNALIAKMDSLEAANDYINEMEDK